MSTSQPSQLQPLAQLKLKECHKPGPIWSAGLLQGHIFSPLLPGFALMIQDRISQIPMLASPRHDVSQDQRPAAGDQLLVG